MTIIYLKDVKKFRAEDGPGKGANSVGVVEDLREPDRKSLWSGVSGCLHFQLNPRKSVKYSPSSSWLLEHSSQWLECVRDGRS